MKILTRPIWYLPAALFLLHQLTQYGLGWSLPWVDDYLDPLLCMPVLLGLLVVDRGWLFGRPTIGLLETLVVTTALSALFELGFPRWEARFVADWRDVPLYFIGAMAFWWLQPAAQKS